MARVFIGVWHFLAVSAVLIAALQVPTYIAGLAGGIIEYVFAAIVLVQAKKSNN